MDNRVIEILLIEDNMQDAELTLRALKKNNLAHHILHVRDGAAALDFMFPLVPVPDNQLSDIRLILLDLKMPKVDGLEVLKRIKTDERTKTIPTVVLTSSKQELDIQEAFKAGANSYVVKPVAFTQFTEAVSKIGSYWLTLNQSSQ